MFICQDNLEYIKTLDKDTIDLIYFDPPFAVTEADYDKKLNWLELWPEMWRVLKPKGTIVIHSSQPFTFDLVASQRKYFKYCWYWNKGFKTGHLFSKKQPMRLLEEICVFYKKIPIILKLQLKINQYPVVILLVIILVELKIKFIQII